MVVVLVRWIETVETVVKRALCAALLLVFVAV